MFSASKNDAAVVMRPEVVPILYKWPAHPVPMCSKSRAQDNQHSENRGGDNNLSVKSSLPGPPIVTDTIKSSSRSIRLIC